MKRVVAACIEQTLHFQLKEHLDNATASRAIREEINHYKTQLDRSRTKYRILEESVQPDDSVILKIKKQYVNHDCGDYLA